MALVAESLQCNCCGRSMERIIKTVYKHKKSSGIIDLAYHGAGGILVCTRCQMTYAVPLMSSKAVVSFDVELLSFRIKNERVKSFYNDTILLDMLEKENVTEFSFGEIEKKEKLKAVFEGRDNNRKGRPLGDIEPKTEVSSETAKNSNEAPNLVLVPNEMEEEEFV